MKHDLRKIRKEDVERILRQISVELAKNPKNGEPLRGEFKGLFKFRVGNYRIIYTISGVDVVVLRIRHRAKAYD